MSTRNAAIGGRYTLTNDAAINTGETIDWKVKARRALPVVMVAGVMWHDLRHIKLEWDGTNARHLLKRGGEQTHGVDDAVPTGIGAPLNVHRGAH